ncbi:hypothetical protein [Nannocystis sp.]|uniref:CASTOR/POLLUX-related putative ion channel n=1 Tax=Nannocystis sp. TaxID=1962667 RepID=UPI0025F46D6E|nr:hypothetical protein [Nannocystis sp.]MBK7830131.1 potassium transporter TrkA [Nannocystis sp.]
MSTPTPPTLGDRFRYRFDALMSRGAWALILWHLIMALAAVLAVSLLVILCGEVPADADGVTLGFLALLWTTLMHAIDPGTITGDEGSRGWQTLMMIATVGGILLVGSLVAVLVASVAQRFDALRRGHSRVLEQGHTLVLGWSRQIFTIVSELAAANQSHKGGCIVIYADLDKLWMDQALRAQLRGTGRTRVVVRAGDPTDPGTLHLVAPEHARSIVVLAPEAARDDTQVIRTLLAVGRCAPAPGRSQHVVTEIRDPRNLAVARLTGERRIEVLEIGDLVAKIAVQTCLQSGLSVVYDELLGFAGDEIYFVDAAPLVGHSFAHALHQFEDCTLLGLRGVDGRVQLMPAMDRVVATGEKLILIAADDNRCNVRPWSGSIDEACIVANHNPTHSPERTLILGWNTRVPAIVRGIAAYVAPGSAVLVVSSDPAAAPALAELAAELHNVTLEHRVGDISDRRVLDAQDPRAWHHVMVLPDDRIEVSTEADAQVLVALLHLRDIAADLTIGLARPFSLVSEMRDVRSRDLAEVARADDFIISDRFIGLLLAQLAENAELSAVFAELFDPEGAEIYLRPAANYVALDRELDLHTLVQSGVRRGEVVIGIRLARPTPDDPNHGIIVNPRKSTRLRLSRADQVIVLAES